MWDRKILRSLEDFSQSSDEEVGGYVNIKSGEITGVSPIKEHRLAIVDALIKGDVAKATQKIGEERDRVSKGLVVFYIYKSESKKPNFTDCLISHIRGAPILLVTKGGMVEIRPQISIPITALIKIATDALTRAKLFLRDQIMSQIKIEFPFQVHLALLPAQPVYDLWEKQLSPFIFSVTAAIPLIQKGVEQPGYIR